MIHTSSAADRLVAWNTARIRRIDADAPNPQPVDAEPWARRVRAAHPAIRAEWDAFADGGGQLPYIDDFLDGWQGNVGGWWRTGGLISRGRPRSPLADLFPQTVETLLEIPHLLSAIWSVLGPGAELPPHTGLNAGALNLLVGVHCPEGSGHEIEGVPVSVDGGRVVLFDDTLPHTAWNRSDEPRVLLIGDVLRPLAGLDGAVNTAVQWCSYHLTPGYRRAIRRGAELHRELNE